MVGSPAYQNWQHVYTAVTRGVRQVLIINNPGSLFKAIKSLPVRRQTKLQEDMLEAMRYRCSIQEYGNTQSANQFRDVQFTSQSFEVKNTTSVYSASEVHAHLHTCTRGSFNVFCRWASSFHRWTRSFLDDETRWTKSPQPLLMKHLKCKCDIYIALYPDAQTALQHFVRDFARLLI